jgi:RNase adapter protein RapZ
VSDHQPHIVFVSGLSGSGRTTAMAALEDLSFYCVDNLPAELTPQFLDLCAKSTPPIRKIALALDAREESFLRGLPGVLADARESGARVDVVFLDCSNQVLMNRYRETRRVHPLSPGGSVEKGIERERQLLAHVARLADVVVDTSDMNVHQLRDTVIRAVKAGARATVVNLLSFGFRYGPPPAAELLFDVRFLPNPHFEPELRPRTGLDPDVSKYVVTHERAQALVERLRALLAYLLPLYDEEGKAYLTVGVGCTGGRHRSVAIVEVLADHLRAAGRIVNVTHRDVEKST